MTTTNTRRRTNRFSLTLVGLLLIAAGPFIGVFSPVGAEETNTQDNEDVVEEKSGLTREGVFGYCEEWAAEEESYKMDGNTASCSSDLGDLGTIYIRCENSTGASKGWDCTAYDDPLGFMIPAPSGVSSAPQLGLTPPSPGPNTSVIGSDQTGAIASATAIGRPTVSTPAFPAFTARAFRIR